MESHLSPRFKKWMKKSLSDEFSQAIEDNLNGDRDSYDVAQKIINSREMTELMNAIRTSFVEQIDASRATTRQTSARTSAANSRPQTSLSYMSELSTEDWSAKAGGSDEIGQIVDRMGFDKPDHVRLAGYEALLEAELANASANSSWDALLKALRDGLVDGGKSVFEASLLVHAKLLNYPQFSDPYANLLNAFAELYHSKKMFETLPTLLSGVNFKVFLHEKLFRVMRLIVDHHEEVLKGIRTADKTVVEMIEQFVAFLASQTLMSAAQIKPLSALQILAVLEPQAGWSNKWMHSLITRRILCTAVSKSPSLVQTVVASVKRGLDHPPPGVTVAMSDEPLDVYVSGESIETLSFLHGLNFLVQLCCSVTGRGLLSETLTEDAFSIPDFLTALLGSLNGLASSEASNAVYEAVRAALAGPLRRPDVLYDARFCQLALSPLVQSEVRMWPHTLDVLTHLLDTLDGPTFLMTEYRIGSASENTSPSFPVVVILSYACNILRQPVAVMSVEHVVDLFRFIGKLFRMHQVFYVVEEIVRENFYPSVTYMYSKLDKYYVENEYKTQHLDKVVKEMLLSVVSIPLGLQMLSNEPLVFEELIRGSIAPVRASWSAYDVVSFISNSGFLARGTQVLRELAPHVLSTLLIEIGKILEDPQQFHDPWEHPDVQVFLHALALFSLNTNCFVAFMTGEKEDHIGEEVEEEDNEYLTNLHELFYNFLNVGSSYHHLGLLSLKAVIWNLDIYIYLLNLLDFQQKLLEFQEYGTFLKDDQVEPKTEFIVDENSLLRHAILLSCYYVRYRRSDYIVAPEETRLFSKLPPPDGINDDFVAKTSSESELTGWLQDSGPGLRDNNWVLQTRKAHRASSAPMKNSLLLNLLNQMEQAIPTMEWVEKFKWDADIKCNDDYWLPEEIHGIEVAIHYGVINGQLEKTDKSERDLKVFIQSAHKFINFNKPVSYEGFDWFLATVFLICSGDTEKAKIFVSQILNFPSSMFMWPALGRVIDENNEKESSTKLLFAHLLESVISHEFPTIKFALKNECGMDWWMICDRLLTQCFWGILPWSEIVHYFAICILHPPDYVLYYCASLLNHCEDELIKNVTKGKLWPENLILEDFRCHSQIGFMDRLGKRHGGKVLPPLSQRKMNFSENFNSVDEEEGEI